MPSLARGWGRPKWALCGRRAAAGELGDKGRETNRESFAAQCAHTEIGKNVCKSC